MRKRMNRGKTARVFNRKASRTKAINIAPPPQRGGYRL